MTASPVRSTSCALDARRARRRRSPPATEVFLVRAMKTLMIGGIDHADGLRQDDEPTAIWPKPSPMLRAASACPTGTPLMPERSASATNGEV